LSCSGQCSCGSSAPSSCCPSYSPSVPGSRRGGGGSSTSKGGGRARARTAVVVSDPSGLGPPRMIRSPCLLPARTGSAALPPSSSIALSGARAVGRCTCRVARHSRRRGRVMSRSGHFVSIAPGGWTRRSVPVAGRTSRLAACPDPSGLGCRQPTRPPVPIPEVARALPIQCVAGSVGSASCTER